MKPNTPVKKKPSAFEFLKISVEKYVRNEPLRR